jgi:enoyl-[acyl-carrier-protein] reductase (NADH)
VLSAIKHEIAAMLRTGGGAIVNTTSTFGHVWAARDALIALHPVGRFGKSEEIAAAVLYLCSDAAKFTTGTSLKVDGGWLAQ